MKLNKNEQNYLLTILFKSYILQSVICSGIILVCTVSLDMGLTWVLDRYVEHYYLIYRGLYVYMVGLILWVVCILYLTYKLLKKVVNYVYELQAATGKLFDKSVDYIELSPELSEIAININRLKQEAENNARLAQENEQRKNDLIMYLAHDLKTPLSSVIGYLTLLHDDEQQISQELREKYLSISLDKAERLEDLINEFFEITRFNLSNITLQYSNINLTRLLEQLIYEFKPILKEKNLKCSQLSMLRASNIGFVFQNYSLIKHLRVWENIELPLLYSKKKMNTRQRKEAIRNLLQSVGLILFLTKHQNITMKMLKVSRQVPYLMTII